MALIDLTDSAAVSALGSTLGSVKLPDFNLGSVSQPSSPAVSGSRGTSGPDTIQQTERLFTTRSRGAFINPEGGGDRGTRAYILLLTSDPVASGNRTGPGNGLGAPNTLTGPGNPLDQAIYGGKYGGYADFLLTGVRCSLDEKLQITETFGDGEVAYYFGRQPIIFSLSGVLIDSQDNDWFTQWIQMYGHVMRGSQLAKNYELLKIVLPNMDLIGSIHHMSYQQDAANDVALQFEFQFLAKQIIPKPVTVPGRPLSNSAQLLDFSKADSFLSQQGINSIKSQAGAVLQTIQNPLSTVGDISAVLQGYGRGTSGLIGPGRLSPPGSTALSRGIDSVTGGVSGVTSTVNDAFYSVSANLAGIRASLFSPIYGVLTSLTKLVRNVLGSPSSIFNSITSPVADIVRDVMNVSGQAAGLLNMVNSALNSRMGIEGLGDNFRHLIGSLTLSTGCIATQPWTATTTLRQLMMLGRLPLNSGYMQNQPLAALSSSSGHLPTKAALLSSGPPPSPQAGAIL